MDQRHYAIIQAREERIFSPRVHTEILYDLAALANICRKYRIRNVVCLCSRSYFVNIIFERWLIWFIHPLVRHGVSLITEKYSESITNVIQRVKIYKHSTFEYLELITCITDSIKTVQVANRHDPACDLKKHIFGRCFCDSRQAEIMTWIPPCPSAPSVTNKWFSRCIIPDGKIVKKEVR